MVSLFVLCLLLAGLACKAPKAWATLARLDAPQWTKWRYQGLDVHCADKATAAAIPAEVRFPAGVEVSLRDCAVLEKSVRTALPAVSVVRVSRNWFTRRLEIEAEMRAPLAQIPDGRFIDADGYVYTPDAASAPANLFLINSAAPSNGRMDGRTVTLAKAVLESASLFPSSPVKLECGPGETDSVVLRDGTRIKWGEAGFVREKAMRIAQVYNKTAAKFPAPYNIDLSYFEDGKILLSQAPAAPSQLAQADGI
ncbi:MAG: cell division protein FtsQ/DivIB [Elusimicrobiaceae bacterium]|nr:cell division protein FtsQ/DivIB [Elusimicrobiaceae bacterium]